MFNLPKILIGLAIILFIAIFFIFRSDISNFLSFGDDLGKGVVLDDNILPKDDFPDEPGNGDKPDSDNVVINPPTSLSPAAGGNTNPQTPGNSEFLPYTGRNPREVRPDPEEVKLFSEEQKIDIYNKIDNHGQVVGWKPDFFYGWIQIGVLKKVIGDFEGSRDAWEYAGLIAPKNGVSFGNLGELYWRYLHEYPKSEKNFRIAIKNNPSDYQLYVSLSELYYYSYTEKANLADDVLLEGITNNPDNVDLMRFLARHYERVEQYARAIEWWNKVLEREPNDTLVAERIKDLQEK